VNLRSYAPPKSPFESPGLTQSLLPHVFSSPNGSPDQYSTFDASLNVWVGVISLRLSRPGSYHLFMIHTETKQLISKIHRVKIDVNFLFSPRLSILSQVCGQLVTPTPYHQKNEMKQRESNPPRPLLRYKGVFSISGKGSGRGITVPNKLLPSKVCDSLTKEMIGF
jgi:hypothetical protein